MMTAVRVRTTTLCLLLFGLGAGCGSSGAEFLPDPDRSKDLPDDPAELVHISDSLLTTRLAEKPPLPSKTDRALAALEKALARSPRQPFEVYWRLSKACFLMSEALDDKVQRQSFALRGVEYAQRARRLEPQRVEPHIFVALNTAQVALCTSNVNLIASMMASAQEAAKLDARYEDAAPLRMLGKIYLTAPAWPVSVGSPEKGVEVLKRAVAVAPVPLNRIFLGEAYYHDEEYDLAEKELRTALEHGRANRLDEQWRKEARDYLNRIAAGSSSDPRNNP